jgi:hypothetical protein
MRKQLDTISSMSTLVCMGTHFVKTPFGPSSGKAGNLRCQCIEKASLRIRGSLSTVHLVSCESLRQGVVRALRLDWAA